MNPNFDSLFDSYLTQAKHYRNYLETKGYQEDDFGNYYWQPQDATDLEAESVDYRASDHPLDESEPF